ncbi:hypothetical protein [Massilia sp. GCM10023247]|uniref:hypothetical protein n=1 Tax=Massilia sp. GCM10023247 TaxID=3252643 RepID=UPI0036109FE0
MIIGIAGCRASRFNLSSYAVVQAANHLSRPRRFPPLYAPETTKISFFQESRLLVDIIMKQLLHSSDFV